MRDPNNNTIDERTGSVHYNGPSVNMPGNHDNMPARSAAYLPGDDRGHVQASSLGGTNRPDNIVPQNRDVNRHDYRAIERGETKALKSGAAVQSDKTAFASNQPGQRPDNFIVNDQVTYRDGHQESIHMSVQNNSHADQQAWNDKSAAMLDDAPNSANSFHDNMTVEEYSAFDIDSWMEGTNQELPGITDEYDPADFSGMPSVAWDSGLDAASNSESVSAGVSADNSTDSAAEAEGSSADASAGAGDTGAEVGEDADSATADGAAADDSAADNGADADGGADCDPD